MDKSDITNFLKEQRQKMEEESYKGRKEYSSHLKQYEEPSNTIMVQGLPSSLTEDDIKFGLDDLRANYIAVRLIKDRRTGINKGIAFVEFIAVNDAKDVMEDTRGELNISGYICRLTYGYNVKEEIDMYDADKSNSWKMEKPTNTIMLRGVSGRLSDNEVRAYVAEVSRHVVDVRLIRDKNTGMSRGFGFVEFDSVAEAQRWMEYQQGLFIIEDSEIKLSYNSTRQGSTQMSEFFAVDAGDWSCARCGGHNFKRRDFCYKCHLSKSQSRSVMETIDGKEQLGMSPCTTLLLRDLDALTFEDAIVKAFKVQFKSNVWRCEVMRDDVTKVSRCFAFVELSSLSESRRIVEYYEDNPDKVFELSGKAVTIDYAKNSFSTLIASYKEALAKRFEDTYEPPAQETSNYDANAAAAVAQAALNHKKMHKKGTLAATVLPANVTVDGRGPESAMRFELIVNGQRCTSVPTNPFTMTNLTASTFVRPDSSQFLYDQSTQYYFDPVTGLYYDTSSKYFFDRMSQQYLFWDEAKATFVPVATTFTSDTDVNQSKVIHKDGKKSMANEAKKVAKEMDKWERMINSKKDRGSVQPVKEMVTDLGCSVVTVTDHCPAPSLDQRGGEVDKLVAAAYNSDSGSEDAASPQRAKSPASVLRSEEERLIDWEKVACLLCNRGFKDRATLDKHRSVSELHRKNLELLKEKMCVPAVDNRCSSTAAKIKYRDRAKERRDKFGAPSPPSSRPRYEVPMEQHCEPAAPPNVPAAVDADGNNIGSRLMAKMGWQQGQGLGKLNQGRTELVQAEFVSRGAGIGATPKFQGYPSDNYRDNLRRVMYAKYHDS